MEDKEPNALTFAIGLASNLFKKVVVDGVRALIGQGASKIVKKGAENLTAKQRAVVAADKALKAQKTLADAAPAKLAAKKAADVAANLATKLTPKVLLDKLPENIKKQAKETLGDELENVLKNAAKQLYTSQKDEKGSDILKGSGTPTLEGLVKSAIRRALNQNQR